MGFSSRSYARPYIGVPGLPRGIKWLLIINIGVFLLQWFSQGRALGRVFGLFELYPVQVVGRFYIWQLATYMFLHGGIWHILWNMLALWMFGADLEQSWGTDRFIKFYFFCGIGAGLCVVGLNYLFGNPAIPTVGSSGAIYGILLASAVLWPDRLVLFSFLIPIKMKYFVMIMGAIAFLNSRNVNSGVSDIAHLGGMAFAYAFMKMRVLGSRRRAGRGSALGFLRDRYNAWKLARARKKFQVYLRKHGSGGPDIN
jgi:membrane associated rhomboid family serine protease